jgi:hypothetical protein
MSLVMQSRIQRIVYNILNIRNKNKYNMRIFLFTAEDLPAFKDQNARNSALKYAK